jgi:hypothetical protein
MNKIIEELTQLYRPFVITDDDLTHNRAIAECINTVEKQPTIESDKWIPITERLPERNKTVFVYAEGTRRNGDLYTVGSCHNGFWFLPNSEDTFGFPFTSHKVIAWQPLPEAYKPEESVK